MPSLSAPYFAVHDPLAYTMPSHSLLSSQYLTGVPFSTSGSGRRKYSQHANDRNKGQSEHYGQKDENTNHNTQSRWQKRAAESFVTKRLGVFVFKPGRSDISSD
jgi:hypothetical protein